MKILVGLFLWCISTLATAQYGKEYIDFLKGGGYTIFFRHSITDGADPNKINPPNENIRDCNTQRQLNREGREQAKLIGEKFREYEIPVGDVYSSPVCRCADTAKLAFGKVTTMDWMALGSSRQRMPELEKHLKTVPYEGFLSKTLVDKNNIYVGHAQTLTQKMIGPSFPPIFLMEGEGIIFDPSIRQYIGRIYPSKW